MGLYAHWKDQHALEQGGIFYHYAILPHNLESDRESEECDI